MARVIRGPAPKINKNPQQRQFNAVESGANWGRGIGNSLVPGMGGTIGGAIGSGLGYLYRTITGSGAYEIKENTLIKSGTPIPSFGPSCVRLRHKEYLQDVISSSTIGAFNLNTLPINPGMPNTFPWLAAIASNFEEYRFLGLIFEYVSTSADALNSTNTALGKIVLATDYNATNPQFTSVEQMMSTEFSNYAKPSDSIIHAVECARIYTPMELSYVRSGVPNSSFYDLKMYDLGNFQFATQGLQAASVNIGSIWVSYDVMLCKPILSSVGGGDVLSEHWALVAPSTSAYFGTSRILVPGSNIGLTFGLTTVLFPSYINSGAFMIGYTVYGTNTAVTVPVVTGTNCVLENVWNNTTSNNASNTGSTSANFLLNFVISVTGQSPLLTFGSGSLPTTAGYGDLWVMQINPLLI